MKLRLGRTASDIVVAIYLFATLLIRFLLESQIQSQPIISLLIGGFCLLFLWALVKSKFLNPGWFGLLKKR